MGDEYNFPKLWGVFSQHPHTGAWHCERTYSTEGDALAGTTRESQQVIELEVMRAGAHSSLGAALDEALAGQDRARRSLGAALDALDAIKDEATYAIERGEHDR